MPRLPVDLVAFDLMGTVIEDTGAMDRALKRTLSHHKVPFNQQEVDAMRGAAKVEVFRAVAERALGAGGSPEACLELAEKMYRTFKQALRDAYAETPPVEIPGAAATMRWLRERGVKVAATSALDTDQLGPMLDRLGWAEGVFDCKVSTYEVPRGRPAPYMIFQAMMRTGVVDVRRVAAVGDTPLDLMAGTNAGLRWVIGVLSGAHRLESLGVVPHTHILNSVADLPRILEG
ncbi:MAG: HAD family hydrolase [Sphingomonadaceae bacterium]